MGRHQDRLNRKERRLKGKVRFRTLFLLAITLIFNTYAWFLYVNTVSADLTAHVDAWQVRFEVEGEEVVREFTFNISHAYPGMPDTSKTVTVINNGEKDATMTYEIRYVRIFDDIYFASENIAEGQTAPQGATIKTAAQLLSMIQSDYPFEIDMLETSQSLSPEDEANFTITFKWDYESGHDSVDTQYGVNAYNYYDDTDDDDSIEIIIRVIVSQDQNNNNNNNNEP